MKRVFRVQGRERRGPGFGESFGVEGFSDWGQLLWVCRDWGFRALSVTIGFRVLGFRIREKCGSRVLVLLNDHWKEDSQLR